MKDIAFDFLHFYKKNLPLLLGTLVLGCICYGYALTHYMVSIDTETVGALIKLYIEQGRWGIAFIKVLFGSDAVLPFFAPFCTLLILAITALIFCKVLRFDSFSCSLFCLFFITFPQFAYLIQFSFFSVSMAIGMFSATLSVILIEDYLHNRQKTKIVLACLLLTFAISIYQSLALISVTLFLLVHLQKILHAELTIKEFFSTGFIFSLVCLVSLSFYLVFTPFLQHVTGFGLSPYIENFSAWKTETAAKCLHDIAIQYWVIFTGNSFFGERPFLSIWLALGILIFHVRARLTRSNAILLALTCTGLFILSFAIVLVMGRALPARIFLSQSLLFATFWALAAAYSGKKMRICICALGIWFAIINGIHITQLFYSENTIREADKLLAAQIVMRIYDAKPDFQTTRHSVHFEGSYRHPALTKLRRAQTFGSSFFRMGGETGHRIRGFLEMSGMGVFSLASDLSPEQRALLATMPEWPNPGAVQAYGDIVLVKLEGDV